MRPLISGALGFLSWNIYVTFIIIPVLFYLGYRLLGGTEASVHWALWSLQVCISTIALPRYQRDISAKGGVDRTAASERVTPFKIFRHGDDVRYDLRAENPAGSTCTTYFHRDAGPFGPYLLGEIYGSKGDCVTGRRACCPTPYLPVNCN